MQIPGECRRMQGGEVGVYGNTVEPNYQQPANSNKPATDNPAADKPAADKPAAGKPTAYNVDY